MKLAGRICLITGASSGLGRRIAIAFWREGASLLLAGLQLADLEESQELLGPQVHADQRVRTFAGDLAEADKIASLTRTVRETFGSVAVLVNNAAVPGPIGPLVTNDWAAWEHTIRINLLVPAALCVAVIPMMQQLGFGKIINLSGGGATGPRPNFSSYAAAKAALVRLSETLAQELAPHGIDVNCVAPGILDTQMTGAVVSAGMELAGESEVIKARQCADSVLAFQRATDLAVFLASAESDGISGRLISAVWDSWRSLPEHREELQRSDIYTLRRIVAKDRGLEW